MDSLSNNKSSLLGYQEIAAKQNEVSFGEAASRIVVNDGKIEGQSFLGRVWASLTKSSDAIKQENVAAKNHFINAIKSRYSEAVADKVQQSLVEVGEKRALTSSDIKNGLKLAGLLAGTKTDKSVVGRIGDCIDAALSQVDVSQLKDKDQLNNALEMQDPKFIKKTPSQKSDGSATVTLSLDRDVANKFIEQQIEGKVSTDQAITNLQEAINDVLIDAELIATGNVEKKDAPINKDQLDSGCAAIKQAGLTKELTSKEVKIKGLNEAPWWPIKTPILKVDSGLKRQYESTITPASNLACLKKSYKADGIRGVCSKDERNASHTINGAVDKLKVLGEDGKPKQILQVVRSGVLTSAKIKDEGERTFAANNRFDENLLMALEAKGLLPASGEAAKGTPEKPVELSIADIGLLSKNVIKGKEENMQDDQFKFLEGANNQTREISYTDEAGQEKTIWVKPKILAFNFGVQVSDRIQGQSELTKQNNEASLDTLLGKAGKAGTAENPGGMVEDFLKSPEGLALYDNDRKAISDLASQCREMRANGEMYSFNDGDIYAFPARLTVLCDKIGIMPMIHCKSGKDRTSRLAEEAKFLAAEIHESTLGDDEGNPPPSERETIAFVSPKDSGRFSPVGIADPSQTEETHLRVSFDISTGDDTNIIEGRFSEKGALLGKASISSNVEAKAVSTFHPASAVPQKGRITDDKRTKAFIAFSSHSGNKEIQELNTGKPGNMQSWSYLQRMRSNMSDHMTVLPVVGKYFRDDIAQAYAGKSESVET